MWLDRGDVADDLGDDLFSQLTAALPPSTEVPRVPSAVEIQSVRAAVVARRAGLGPETVQDASRRRRFTGRLGRVGATAAAAVIFSASAAAASGDVPLPGPVRAAAHAVGLPVDSPALVETHRHLDLLDEAVKAGDLHRVAEVARRLHVALARVPQDEHAEAKAEVEEALTTASPLLSEAPSLDRPGLNPAADESGEPPGTRPAPASVPTRGNPATSAPASGSLVPRADPDGEPLAATGPGSPRWAASSDPTTGEAMPGDGTPDAADEPPSPTAGSGIEERSSPADPAPPTRDDHGALRPPAAGGDSGPDPAANPSSPAPTDEHSASISPRPDP